MHFKIPSQKIFIVVDPDLKRLVKQLFYYAPRKINSGEHIVAVLSVRNSCLAHNFVILSKILKLFHRNDHHIETMCRAQHLGHYLKGLGHSIWVTTLKV